MLCNSSVIDLWPVLEGNAIVRSFIQKHFWEAILLFIDSHHQVPVYLMIYTYVCTYKYIRTYITDVTIYVTGPGKTGLIYM